MRIVAGRWRGRKIEAPEGSHVRPTLDRVREAWMSILQSDIPGARVVDLFSGSGALGLEALSRGAESADFVENNPLSLRFLRKNIDALGAADRAVVHRKDALRFAKSLPPGEYDLAFADPPYASGFAEKLAGIWLAGPFASILSVEHDSRSRIPGGHDTRRYGSSSVTFFRTGE
jgi:16S rRNA (guanine966-N2)-methyltransferase